MYRFVLSGIVIPMAICVFAQVAEMAAPSSASLKYREYRHQETAPSYGLAKVRSLIKSIKTDKDDNRVLPVAQYSKLTLPEKFTYTMLHGEDFSQNCDVMPPIADEEKKVFSYIPGPFYDEATWSQRQRDFLHDNRSKVIDLLRETMLVKKRIGVNLKAAVLELNAWELIPDMVKVYKIQNKDHDILTLMMLLMKEGNYKPFMESTTYKKFYGDDSNYQAFVMANSANQKLTIDRAMGYYKSNLTK